MDSAELVVGDGQEEAGRGCWEQKHHPEKTVGTTGMTAAPTEAARAQVAACPHPRGRGQGESTEPATALAGVPGIAACGPLPPPPGRQPGDTSESSSCGLSSLTPLLSHLPFLPITALSLSPSASAAAVPSVGNPFPALRFPPLTPAHRLLPFLEVWAGSWEAMYHSRPPKAWAPAAECLAVPCALPPQPGACLCRPPRG